MTLCHYGEEVYEMERKPLWKDQKIHQVELKIIVSFILLFNHWVAYRDMIRYITCYHGAIFFFLFVYYKIKHASGGVNFVICRAKTFAESVAYVYIMQVVEVAIVGR